MNSRLLKRFSAVAVLALAGAFTLLVGQKAVSGQNASDETEDAKLAGTWNVTLKFPDCTLTCPCPGGIPNIPIPALHTYLKGESLLEVPGGSLFRGPGVGTWEQLDDHDFAAHFKFFLFKFDGTGGPRGSEVVTSQIDLTGPDTFDAAATFDLFDTAGNMTAQGCPINETATRF